MSDDERVFVYIFSLVVSIFAVVAVFVAFVKSIDIIPLCDQACYPYKAYEFDKEKQKCVCNMTRMYKDIK